MENKMKDSARREFLKKLSCGAAVIASPAAFAWEVPQDIQLDLNSGINPPMGGKQYYEMDSVDTNILKKTRARLSKRHKNVLVVSSPSPYTQFMHYMTSNFTGIKDIYADVEIVFADQSIAQNELKTKNGEDLILLNSNFQKIDSLAFSKLAYNNVSEFHKSLSHFVHGSGKSRIKAMILEMDKKLSVNQKESIQLALTGLDAQRYKDRRIAKKYFKANMDFAAPYLIHAKHFSKLIEQRENARELLHRNICLKEECGLSQFTLKARLSRYGCGMGFYDNNTACFLKEFTA